MFFKKDKREHVMQFFKIVSRHHKVGRNIAACVEEYAKTYDNPEMKEVCRSILKNLSSGSDFAPALEKNPEMFQPFVVEFVRVGETTNQLDTFFKRISDRLHQDMVISKKINSATLMPKISLAMIFCAFIFAVYYLIPKMGDAFKQVNLELPLLTRIVMQVGEFLAAYWFIIPIAVVIPYIYIKYYKKNHPVEYSLLALRIPFYKELAYNKIQFDFCEIFSLCLGAKIRSAEALRFTAMAMDVLYMRLMLQKASKLMVQGESLVTAIRKADYEHVLSAEVMSMLQTGIETSRTEEIMRIEAGSYLEELNFVMENIGDKISATVLVPTYALMIAFFLIVEWPLQSIMSNIGNITQGIGG